MMGKYIIDNNEKRYKIVDYHKEADEMVAESENGELINLTSMDLAEGRYEVVGGET